MLKNCVYSGKKKLNDQENLKKWEIIYKFNLQPRKLNDFDEMCQYQQDSDSSFLKHNAVTCIQTKEGKTVTWGQALCKIKYIDPYSQEIVTVVEAKTEKEFKDMLKVHMGIEINFPLFIKAKDYSGFA